MSRILTVQELIDLLAVKPNPLDVEGVSGLTIEIHPNPGQGHLFTFLALTYTPVMGLITRKGTAGVPGSSWQGTIHCEPLFIRSLIMPIERAGLWELDHYHPPPPEDLMMCDPNTYFIRIKDTERGQDKIVYLFFPELAPERSIQKLTKAITSLTNRTRRRFVWQVWLHSLVRRLPVPR